jgi:hypothetical protein
MMPLLFIMLVTSMSVFVSCHCTPNVTWFTYYLGTVVGMFVSGMVLDIWTRRARRYIMVVKVRRYI